MAAADGLLARNAEDAQQDVGAHALLQYKHCAFLLWVVEGEEELGIL